MGALRKKYGSVAAFERIQGLPKKSVHDLLRGRQSSRVKEAIESVLGTGVSKSELSDGSRSRTKPHRLNMKAR